jgi:hypothetical protein
MAITQRTVEEAKAYISESIKHWEEANEINKIISLAKWADRWSKKTLGGITPATKIKTLKKNINSLIAVINRYEKIHPGYDSSQLKVSLKTAQDQYDKLIATHGEPIIKPRKTKGKEKDKPVEKGTNSRP